MLMGYYSVNIWQFAVHDVDGSHEHSCRSFLTCSGLFHSTVFFEELHFPSLQGGDQSAFAHSAGAYHKKYILILKFKLIDSIQHAIDRLVQCSDLVFTLYWKSLIAIQVVYL